MRQTFPPKDAEEDVVFSATSYLNIALDAASLISALSPLLKAANQDFVTSEVTMNLHFFGQVLHFQQEKISISRCSVPPWPVRPCTRLGTLEAGEAPGQLGTTVVGRGTRDHHGHLLLL